MHGICARVLLPIGITLIWLITAIACGPPKDTEPSIGTRARGTTPPPRSRAGTAAPPRARPVPAKGLRVTGTLQAVAGHALPARAKVAVMFVVSSGSPDYVYAYGTGTSRGATFEVTLQGPPPTAALNSGVFGMGMLLLLPETTAVPKGRLHRRAWKALARAALGGADRFGVLYRSPLTATLPMRNWMKQFPIGYRCGRGFKPAGSRFEGFKPVSCTQLVIKVAPFGKLHWVNWT